MSDNWAQQNLDYRIQLKKFRSQLLEEYMELLTTCQHLLEGLEELEHSLNKTVEKYYP